MEQVLAEENLKAEDMEKAKNSLVILNLLARANLYQQIAKQWLEDIEKGGV